MSLSGWATSLCSWPPHQVSGHCGPVSTVRRVVARPQFRSADTKMRLRVKVADALHKGRVETATPALGLASVSDDVAQPTDEPDAEHTLGDPNARPQRIGRQLERQGEERPSRRLCEQGHPRRAPRGPRNPRPQPPERREERQLGSTDPAGRRPPRCSDADGADDQQERGDRQGERPVVGWPRGSEPRLVCQNRDVQIPILRSLSHSAVHLWERRHSATALAPALTVVSRCRLAGPVCDTSWSRATVMSS
jgi:hypothetical protein